MVCDRSGIPMTSSRSIAFVLPCPGRWAPYPEHSGRKQVSENHSRKPFRSGRSSGLLECSIGSKYRPTQSRSHKSGNVAMAAACSQRHDDNQVLGDSDLVNEAGMVKVAHSLRDIFIEPESARLRYDCVLLDQYGVLHDGQDPFQSALECVETLSKLGIRIIILSNSSRRSAQAMKKLTNPKFGYKEEWISSVVTSGEIAWKLLTNEEHLQRLTGLQLDSNVLHCTWATRGSEPGEQVRLPERFSPVGFDVSRASFVLAHGTEAIAVSMTEAKECSRQEIFSVLEEFREANPSRPLLCANPDLVTVDGGVLRDMPGKLARKFEELGGKVFRLGKPDPLLYTILREDYGLKDLSRVVAIGDSLIHDIAGAKSVGIDSVFIAGGIESERFGLDSKAASVSSKGSGALEFPTDNDKVLASLDEVVTAQGGDKSRPNYIIPYLAW